jgi:hypothetical protein
MAGFFARRRIHPTMASHTIASFAPGLNNRRPSDQLSLKLADGTPATLLREAVNCDISAQGAIRRRPGFGLSRAGVVHSVWGDGQAQGYAVIDGVLSSIKVAPTGASEITPITFVGHRRVSYSRGATGGVYWSNGILSGRLVGDVNAPASTESPPVPNVQVTTGALPAGRYLLTFTRTGPAGESAATPLAEVEVPANAGILLTDCMAGTEVYMSGPNGEVLDHAGTAWGSTFAIALPPTDGRRCETLGLAPMPPGDIVRHALGRLVVAAGSALHFSEPYRYGLRNPADSFIQFKAPITVVAPTPSGLYVCADETFWIPSLPPADIATVLPFGALAHSDTSLGDQSGLDQSCAWMSPRGVVVATKAGEASLTQDASLNFSPAERGTVMVRHHMGERSLVITRSGVQPGVSKARDAGT